MFHRFYCEFVNQTPQIPQQIPDSDLQRIFEFSYRSGRAPNAKILSNYYPAGLVAMPRVSRPTIYKMIEDEILETAEGKNRVLTRSILKYIKESV